MQKILEDEKAVASNIAHCISGAGDFGEHPVLWRVYQSSTSFEKTVEYLSKQIDVTYQTSTLVPLACNRLYGILVLVESIAKVKTFSRRIQDHPISKNLLVHVDLGPTSATLARAFKEKWETQKWK